MKRLTVSLIVLALVATAGARSALAHDVAPDPIVELTVKPQGGQVQVVASMPLVALADANLPRDQDGRITQEQGSQALDLVGRNLVGDLELQQDEIALPPPSIRTTIAPAGDSVNVTLTYAIRADAGHLSARLRTYRADTLIVKSVAHYEAAAGVTRTFIVGGDPERVALDPRPLEAIQHFVGQGIGTLLATSEFVLFILCLVAPRRGPGALTSIVGATIVGQWLTVLLQAAGLLELGPQLTIAVSIVAASTVAIAALLSLAQPESRWFAPLGLLFGLLHGASVGGAFLNDLAYAGSHLVLAVTAFLVVVTIGQLWAAALLSSAAGLLFRWGLPERITSIGLAVLVGHSALHLAADRGQLLNSTETITPDRAMVALAIGWAIVILCAGIFEATFGRDDEHRASPLVAGGSRDR